MNDNQIKYFFEIAQELKKEKLTEYEEISLITAYEFMEGDEYKKITSALEYVLEVEFPTPKQNDESYGNELSYIDIKTVYNYEPMEATLKKIGLLAAGLEKEMEKKEKGE